MIKQEIKEEIIRDIQRIEENLMPRGSKQLFIELKTKYLTIDKNFMYGIDEGNHIQVPGSPMAPNYTNELRAIMSKLKTYLLLDQIPVEYNEDNVSTQVINAKKIVNKGNMGVGNAQSKNKQINENGYKKTSLFENLTCGRRK